MKQCSKCKRWLPESEFRKNKSHKDGLHHWCKECEQQYRQQHKEHYKQLSKQYRQQHKEHLKQLWKKWYQQHKEHKKQYNKQYNKNYKYPLQRWSIAVKKRDNYTCQLCGSKKNLVAHHVLSKERFPNLMYNVSNGITLCKSCHVKEHLLNKAFYRGVEIDEEK